MTSEAKVVDVELDWPVLGASAFRLDDTHPNVRFTAVTDGTLCSVVALIDLIAIGSLRWIIRDDDPDTGVISYVYVPEEHRRHGVATALLKAAHAYAEHYGIR
jgi:GNAT superfamily N-acetyltransferase